MNDNRRRDGQPRPASAMRRGRGDWLTRRAAELLLSGERVRPREAAAPEMRDGFFLVPRLSTHEDAGDPS